MKYCKGLAVVTMLMLCALHVVAYDFSVVATTGQTLYFSYCTGGVKAVYPANTQVPAQGWNGFVRPTGALTIPGVVSHDGVNYAVVAVEHHAFYGCNGLTAVTMGEGIAAVRANAFALSTALSAVTMPSTLDSLGASAFYGCSSLQEVIMHCATPPVTASTAFYELPLSGATLAVPCGCVAAYTSVAPWNTFGTITDVGCAVTVATGVNNMLRGSVTGGGEYAEGTQVTLTAVPAEGCFFACWGDGDTLNPRVITAVAGARYVAHFFLYRHDTIHITDTLHPQQYTLSLVSSDPWRGIVVGSATVPEGTEIEIVAIPMDGNAFFGWSDGSDDNPRRVTVTGNMTLTAFFGEYEGIVGVGGGEAAWTASVDGRMLTVRCGVGETVRLFDMQGRNLLTHKASAPATTVVVPAAGAYLVSVGTAPAKRIVID